MPQDIEARIERLLDRLDDANLTDRELAMIEAKIDMLRRLQS